ncbi:MAG: efflux RND transporter periplasmic adaptor subunit, partial [Pseudomonadota bacterium]
MRVVRSPVLLAALSALVLAGCDDAAEVAEERVRAIKPYTVVEPTGGAIRRYSGAIAAANSSALSFPVAGTVATVLVENGDRVAAGQPLATLDATPFDLTVQAARSELASARADAEEKLADFDRKRTLFSQGWVTKAALDSARAASGSAQGQLSLLSARLGIAERDRAKATLAAPFDGVISLRDVDPFVE